MPYCVIEVGFWEPGGGFVFLSSLGSVICEEHAAKNIEQIKKTFFHSSFHRFQIVSQPPGVKAD
jgi:hypothetical protein